MDLEAFRITDYDLKQEASYDLKREVLKNKNLKGRFIKGPIPLPWLKRTFDFPLGTLKVALILWYVSGLMKRKTFPLSNKRIEEFKISRWTKYRALDNLESVGLIRTDRTNKRRPIITILT